MIYRLGGILNFRDLGGWKVADGRSVKNGLLFRGASLHRATDDDLRRLREEFDIRIDFDFRTEKETIYAPDPHMDGVEYLWLPTLDEASGLRELDVFSKYGFMSAEELVIRGSSFPDVQEAARQMYTSIVDNEYSQLQYAVFLQKIVARTEGGIYWHCSQGKDRTGLGAAFLLAALGADRQTILEEYSISNDTYLDDVRKMSERLLSRGCVAAELDVVQTFIGVNVKYFIDALDLIDRKYGGMETYLRDVLLLSDGDREILRERYLSRNQ